MSEPLQDFALLWPDTIDDAVAGLAANPTARLCAGGTDLIVNMRRGLVETDCLIDLSRVKDLKTISIDNTGLRIGAGVVLRDLAQNVAISAAFPAITMAAQSIAGPNHREAATVGGNLCVDTRCLYYNQSHWWRKSNDFCLKYKGDTCHVAPKGNRCRAAYSGDLAPALMVLDAEIAIDGPTGSRQIPIGDLFREDGADYLTLTAGEIITAIFVPTTKAKSVYDKIRVRSSMDFPLAGVAVVSWAEGTDRHFTFALTGTNSMPLKLSPEPLRAGDDADAYFADLSKQVQKAVLPQRTSTIAPHYRRLSAAALAVRLARGLL